MGKKKQQVTLLDDATYRKHVAMRAQRKRRGVSVDVSADDEKDPAVIIERGVMYNALKGHFKGSPMTEVNRHFSALYDCYVAMNKGEDYAFESQSPCNVAGGGTVKRTVFALMKRYLISSQPIKATPAKKQQQQQRKRKRTEETEATKPVSKPPLTTTPKAAKPGFANLIPNRIHMEEYQRMYPPPVLPPNPTIEDKQTYNTETYSYLLHKECVEYGIS